MLVQSIVCSSRCHFLAHATCIKMHAVQHVILSPLLLLQLTQKTSHGASARAQAMDTIIEPRFKEMFQIGPATPLFTSLLESVPEQFVGHPSKLALLAEMLSAESVKAFKEQGWTLPPWRKVASMLAKWGLKVPSHEVKVRSRLLSSCSHFILRHHTIRSLQNLGG